MSSQRKDTLKNLLKKSMFASTAALMLASTSSLAAALVNRNVIADNAVLSSGANLDQNGGNVPFNPASVLTYNNAFSVTANVPAIAGIYVNAVSIPGPGASMTFPNDITLGPIVPPDLILANHALNMIIPAGVNVTLNGGTPFNPGGPPPILAFDPAVAAAAEDAAGNVNPFAPGLGSNVPLVVMYLLILILLII
ncbi:hypothetical protein H6P87_01281 [Rickettsia tillamookensis]|uniref:Uncharacterized protein n=1 Tax=Rickettsia tillamookensis TaxID=2761623 RepID=A0A9E6SR46_9RICK|nr:hypothetical protein [Rickettsia tillamookensis]QQV75717.1 hypothetical protein H6P87_01281 [Rickettsia tillamookensis]